MPQLRVERITRKTPAEGPRLASKTLGIPSVSALLEVLVLMDYMSAMLLRLVRGPPPASG